ncbi:MAG: hypothetical protein ACRDHF_07240 [Tepidiformaceae bacterium]
MSRTLLALLLALPVAAPAAAADVEGPLNARFRGGWVIARVPIASDCGGLYTNNEVHGGRTDSRGGRRFAAGELARVERIEVRRGGRVDVFLDLAEQILEPSTDGPFTLYTPRSCRVQLLIEAPRHAAAADLMAALDELLELHPDARQAEASVAWNGRRREEYPPDYERTLAEHAAWKAEQANLVVAERIDEAIEEAARVNDRIRSDPEYLAAFAAGVAEVRDVYFGDCASLLGARLYPETERGRSQAWNDGYRDGQLLAWHLELLRRLRACSVPVPPVPSG